MKIKIGEIFWPDPSKFWKYPDIVNSLGNHTVNSLHSFSMVFVDFDREDVNFQDFFQNVLHPTRSSAFFMYTIFFLDIKSSWRNIGFTVENVVSNLVIQVIRCRPILPPRPAPGRNQCQQGFTKEFAVYTPTGRMWTEPVFENIVIAMLGINSIHRKWNRLVLHFDLSLNGPSRRS